MVIKPNPNYQPDQAANMQYPSAGSPPQGPPYGESYQAPPSNQWRGYSPQSNPPYPVSSPPFSSGPTPAVSRGESAGYYGSPQPPSYTGPQSPPTAYQQPGYPPRVGEYSSQYAPPNQYNPYQQYPPPAQGPYGGPAPPAASNPGDPLQYQQHYGGYPPNSQQPAAYPPGSVPQTDEERGLMGALGGGVAGGYAGHKMNHGIIGTLGGAYAGHKLEDKWKEHHNKPEPAAQQPIPPPVQQHQPSHTQMLGNFSMSSGRISLDRDYDLIAECTTVNGHQKMSSISLNQVLTNDDGHFKWVASSGNFGGSARNVQLLDSGKVLEAELCRCDGSWNHDRIHLDEKIGNEDGNLIFV